MKNLTVKLTLVFTLICLGVFDAWAADTNTPTSGSTYRFKATVSGTSYYLVAPTESGIGTVTTTESDGTIFTFTQEGEDWYISFTSGTYTYYMYESGSNGQVSISTTKTIVSTVTTNGNFTKIGGSKWIQFNNSSNPKRMGCYSSSQTGVVLSPATSSVCSCTTSPAVTAPSKGTVTASTAELICSSGVSAIGDGTGCALTSYGFVYNTTGTPTITDNKKEVGTTIATGTSFNTTITGLSSGTHYYVRSYAASCKDTVYSSTTLEFDTESKGCTDHYGNDVETATETTGEFGPIYAYYKYSTRQILYTKADLGLAAGKKGIIKSIYFKYGYTSAMTTKTNVDIYMVNSDITELSTSAGHYVTVTSSDKVYSGALNGSGENTWNEIVLTTPFNYDGAGNLIVVIDDNSGACEASGSFVFNAHTTSTDYSQLSTYSDTNNADPSASATWTGASTSNIRPSTMFCIQEQDMTKCTVTFNPGSGSCGTTELEEATAGAGVTLPTPTHSCPNWTFAGWAESNVSSETSVKPTLYAAGSNYKPASNTTLYAVYKETRGGSSKDYTLFLDGDSVSSTYGTDVAKTCIASASDAKMSVTFKCTNVMKNSSNIQFRASNGVIYNTTDLGNITGITITGTDNTDIHYNIGSSENPSSDAGSGGYFKIYNSVGNARYVTISIAFTAGIGTTWYHTSPSCTDPALTVSTTAVNFGTKNLNTSTNETITVLGVNLTQNASLALSGTDAGMFAVSPTSLTQTAGSITGSDNVTITYHPTAEGTHSATLTISSDGAADKTVTLSGTCALVCTTPTLAFDGTSVEKILGSGKFTKIATATGNTLGATITYSSNKTDKAEVDPATGEVTLKEATGNGSPVTITATLASKSTGVACQNEVTKSYTLAIYNKVTWSVNGEEYTTGSPTTQVTQGGSITAYPTDPDGSTLCGGKTFMGWTTAEYDGDSKPGTLYTSLSSMSGVHPTSNVTFYAVFAEEGADGTSEDTYRKGTLSDLTDGKRVIIVNHSSSKALSSTASTYNLQQATVTFSDDKITSPAAAVVWTVTAGSTGKYFKHGGDYLVVSYDGSSHYNLITSSTSDEWTIASGSTSGTYILNSGNYSSYYAENYSGEFKPYTGGSGSAFEMDFYVPAAAYTDYSTSCGTCLPAPVPSVTPRSTSATLTWAAVADATSYTITCTDGTNTTITGTTITFSGLASETTYNYTIKSNGGDPYTCFPTKNGSFTTTSCEDVPYDIYVAPGVKTATIRWKADESTTATIRFYSDAECETELTAKAIVGATSPCNVTGLEENTQYYVKIFAGGTCASSAVSLLTQTTAVEIAEWFTDSIRITLNDIDASASVLIEDKKESGNKTSNVATKLFFSKYYEAYLSVKLWAIYNGTKEKISLANVVVKSANNGNYWGKDNPTGTGADNNQKVLSLASYGHFETGYIYPGEEIIVYSPGQASGTDDHKIIECMEEAHGTAYKTDPDSLWYKTTSLTASISGDDGLLLLDGADTLDVIGGINANAAWLATTKPSWGDADGWNCNDGEDAEGNPLALSTNRCLLVRKNTVHSGDSAVKYNRNYFNTLCNEWWGEHVPVTSDEVQTSCDNFAYVGHYDYEKYYASFDSVTTVSEIGSKRNDDGTYTVPIPLLDTLSCTMLRVKVYEGEVEKASREYKVPIMVKDSKTTKDTIFINSNPNQLRTAETCKECDVVILKGGTLTKALDTDPLDADSVRNLTIYPGGTLIVPEGANYNYHVNSIQFRVQEEETPIAKLKGALRTADGQVIVSRRTNNDRYVFFSLPYDCNVSDIRWSNGETPVRGTDYEILEYDAERRAAEGSTKGAPGHWKPAGSVLKASVGYNVATNSQFLKELIFPMTIGGANANLTEIENTKTTNKVALVQNTSSSSSINNHNWNLVAHPYVSPFNAYSDGKITAGYLECTAPATPPDKPLGDWVFKETSSVYLTMPSFSADKITYEQTLSTTIAQLDPFLAVFVQAVAEGDLTFAQGNRKLTAPARFLAAKAENEDESIFVGVNLSGNDQTDRTSVRIRPDFTNDYQLGYDLQKFTTYYTTKPQIYMKPADLQLAFQAVSDSVAKTTWMPMGVYCYHAGTYTFSLNENYPIDEVEAVYLQDKTTGKTTNLLYNTYTITTTKQLYSNARFSLQVIVNRKAPEVATDIPNISNDSEGVIRKLLINGHVYIQRGAELYDITGKQLR